MILPTPVVQTKPPATFRRAASLLLAVAGLLMIAALFLPTWHIELGAPQYPEGLGMYVWPHGITGQNPEDLNTINELNHYIGMKKIVPDQIPELRFIPYVVGFFAALSLLLAFRPRALGIGLSLTGLTAAGAAGLYDFWRWEYDYGHNLNPHAAIKIPGMSYQPPLLGSAKLLNFTSISWPASGAWMLFGAGLLLFAAWCAAVLANGPKTFLGFKLPARLAASLFVASGLFAACKQQEPIALGYGVDACHSCKMILARKGFGAERITAKGRVYKFDSMECLLEDLKRSAQPGDRYFAVDFSRPEFLAPVENALFLQSASIPSPMGANLSAYSFDDSARAFQMRNGGEILTWKDLRSKYASDPRG